LERIAHRGAKRELPENSLPAFRRAFERTADAIELDVHATRDGIVVVHHDPDLRARLGRPQPRIAELTWNELQRVELAPGIGIPRLADVLALTPADKTVYVEIKGVDIESGVIAAIEQSSARCAVHSFDHAAVARCRDLAPHIPRGVLFDGPPPDEMIQQLELVAARDLWPRWTLIDASLVARAHDAGARVIAWTVNSLANAKALAAMGVDGLCTDDVRLLDALSSAARD
jgi:glycerophosphoryl diester phosphodiesterase